MDVRTDFRSSSGPSKLNPECGPNRPALFAGLAAVLLLTGASASGQTPPPPARAPLAVTIVPKVPLPRSHGPIDTNIELQWNGSGLLEGHLELTFSSAGHTVFRYRSEALVVSRTALPCWSCTLSS
jgi:hypothetical protein